MPRPPKLILTRKSDPSELEKLLAVRRYQPPGTVLSARTVLDKVEEIEARYERQTRLTPIEKRIAEVTANIARLEGDLALYKGKKQAAVAATSNSNPNPNSPSSPGSGSGFGGSLAPAISSTTANSSASAAMSLSSSSPSSSSSTRSPNLSVSAMAGTGSGEVEELEMEMEGVEELVGAVAGAVAVTEFEGEPIHAQLEGEREGDITSVPLPFDKPAPVIDEWDKLVPSGDLDLVEADNFEPEPEPGLEIHTGTPLPMSEDDLDLFAQPLLPTPLSDYAYAAADADADGANRATADDADKLLAVAVDTEGGRIPPSHPPTSTPTATSTSTSTSATTIREPEAATTTPTKAKHFELVRLHMRLPPKS